MFRFPLLVVFTVVLAQFVPSAHAQVSPVSIRVEQISGTNPDKHTTTQKRSLKVHVSNGTSQDQTGLRVKYYYFAKDVKEKDVTVKDTGEKNVDVKARATELVEIPAITATFTETHFEGGSRSRAGKKIEASGEKIVGYGVQVYSGDKLLTENFSSPALKASIAGAKQ